MYNTNEEFDYGGFRELLEAQAQLSTSSSLFAYQFSDPGVYAFYLSTDIYKKMVSENLYLKFWYVRLLGTFWYEPNSDVAIFMFMLIHFRNSFPPLLQYVRVMSQDAQCTEEGPFFPATSRYIIQNGMSIDQDILKSPDWLVILLLLAAVFLVLILLILTLVSTRVFPSVSFLLVCPIHVLFYWYSLSKWVFFIGIPNLYGVWVFFFFVFSVHVF